jgi:hypothetical protein
MSVLWQDNYRATGCGVSLLQNRGTYIDELLLALVFSPASLVLEDHVVIPSAAPSVGWVQGGLW